MRTAKLVVAVLLSALAGTTAANAKPATDAAFLQLLAAGGQQQQTQEDSLPGVGTPAPTYKSPCSISRACGDGNTVACTGSYCANSTKGVKCDSTEYACPGFCTMLWSCAGCPNYTFWCNSLRGDCGVTAEGCDGFAQVCVCPSGGGGGEGVDCGFLTPGSCRYRSGFTCPITCSCCY